MKSVGIIGIGRVGGLVSYNLLEKGYNIRAYDVIENYAKGQIMDLKHAFAFKDAGVEFTNIEEMNDCSLIIITAGFPRSPNETRADLFEKNKKVIEDILNKLDEYKGPIITITNPADAINTIVAREKGRETSFGFGSTLDSARLVNITKNASDFIIGEHGENFVPVLSNKNVDREEIAKRVKEDNLFVIENKKGTEYAPAYHITELADQLLSNGEFSTYASVMCDGEYGIRDLSIGVPVRIKNGRLEKIVEIALDDWENERFKKGIETIRKLTG